MVNVVAACMDMHMYTHVCVCIGVFIHTFKSRHAQQHIQLSQNRA